MPHELRLCESIPAPPLSYTHLGKGRTEYVPPARVKEVKRQIDNYHKFKELTQEWVTLAIELCKLKQTQDDKE